MTIAATPSPSAPGVLRLARGLLHTLEALTALLTVLAWLLQGVNRIIGRCWKALPVAVAGGVVATLNTASCGPLDMGCKIDAWQTGWLEGLTETFSLVTTSMIEGIFTSQVSTLNATAWNVGLSSVNRLAAVMAIVVVGLCSVQIIMTLVAKQRTGILRAVMGAVLAWPVCAISVIVAIRLVGFSDQLAESIIAGSDAIKTLGMLTDMAWVGSIATGNPVGVAMSSLFFLFCIFIPTVLLTIVMAFRNYALVVAIAVAPVSLMTWGLKSLQGMVKGWAKITVALILTKPVMALSIMIAGEMVGAGLTGGGIGPFMTGVVGMFTAAAAPATSMAMVTGAMAIADSGAARGMEQTATNTATKVAGAGGRALNNTAKKEFGERGGRQAVENVAKSATDSVRAKASSFFGKGGSSAPATPGPPEGSEAPSPAKGSGEQTGSDLGKTAGSTTGGTLGGALGSAVPVVGTALGHQLGSHLGGAVGEEVGAGVGAGVETATSSGEGSGGGGGGGGQPSGPAAQPIFAPGTPAAAPGEPASPTQATPTPDGANGAPQAPAAAGANESSGTTKAAGGTTQGGADLSGVWK